MLQYPTTQHIPLITTPNGSIIFDGSRVGLEIVIDAFNAGESPEEIALNFDTLNLSDVYTVIAYYLANKASVDTYIAEREQNGEQLRQKTEAKHGLDDLRQMITKRRINN